MALKVLELKGFKAYRAMCAFNALMLGLKMLPEYMTMPYETFMKALDEMLEADQRMMIRKAAQFVELSKEEIESMICFCTDKNGVPYTKENLGSMNPLQVQEVIAAVGYEISQIKADMLTEDEKKN